MDAERFHTTERTEGEASTPVAFTVPLDFPTTCIDNEGPFGPL